MDCQALISSLLLAFMAGKALSMPTETPSADCSKKVADNPGQFQFTSSQWTAPQIALSCALHCNNGRIGQICIGSASNSTDSDVIYIKPALSLEQCQEMLGPAAFYPDGKWPCQQVCNNRKQVNCSVTEGEFDCDQDVSRQRIEKKRYGGCFYQRNLTGTDQRHRHSQYYYVHHGQIVKFESVRSVSGATVKFECDCIDGSLFERDAQEKGEYLKLCPHMRVQRQGRSRSMQVGDSTFEVKRVFTPRCDWGSQNFRKELETVGDRLENSFLTFLVAFNQKR